MAAIPAWWHWGRSCCWLVKFRRTGSSLDSRGLMVMVMLVLTTPVVRWVARLTAAIGAICCFTGMSVHPVETKAPDNNSQLIGRVVLYGRRWHNVWEDSIN